MVERGIYKCGYVDMQKASHARNNSIPGSWLYKEKINDVHIYSAYAPPSVTIAHYDSTRRFWSGEAE